jgi:hypothetical protein
MQRLSNINEKIVRSDSMERVFLFTSADLLNMRRGGRWRVSGVNLPKARSGWTFGELGLHVSAASQRPTPIDHLILNRHARPQSLLE